MDSEKRTVTLRIKKQYFESIQKGEKTTEYRDYRDYYHGLFKCRPTHLKLHYQEKNMLEAEVKKISVIATPDFLKKSGIVFGPRVYAIELLNPKKIR